MVKKLRCTEWPESRVGDLCSLSSGMGFGPRDWSQSGMPIIRIQNLNRDTDFNYFAGEPDPDVIVEPGDLLFAWAGVAGVSFGPTIWKGPRGLLNQHIYRVRPNEGIHKEWLFGILKIITSKIERKAHGFKSSLLHVRKSDIVDQIVEVPPFNIQKSMVHILETWDSAITLATRLLEAKQKLKKGLMQQLLTGKTRFKEFIRSKETVATKYGPIPKDWDYPRIEEFATEQIKRHTGSEDIPVLSCTKYDGLVDSVQYFGRKVFSDNLSNYKVVRQYQFAYATNHIEEGSIGLLTDVKAGLVSPIYTVFEVNQDRVLPSFLYAVVKSELYRHIFEAATNASVDRRGSLRWKDFSKLHVALPSLSEQAAIAKLLSTHQQSIDLTQRQCEHLKSQKRGLMHKLLTGKVRVKG
jgi:type I restriction enzyme, S subunit